MDQSPRDRADEKVDRARSMYEDHGRVFQVTWIAAGFVVVAAGLAMTVFPGPSTVVVPLGLAMLAVVFGWARRLLLRSIDVGDHAADRFRHASTPVKVVTLAASACLAAAVVAWIVL